MSATVVKVEIAGDNIEVTYADGTKEEIEFGRYERKNSENRTVEERPATAADFDRLTAIAAAAGPAVEHEFTLADGSKVETGPGKIEVLYPDGEKEEIEGGIYERKNAAGETIEERPATDADIARLEALIPAAPASGGDGPDVAGSPDDGSGDAPATVASGDDDGTPDQGSGDAPGTEPSGGDDETPDHDGGDSAEAVVVGDRGPDRIRGDGADEEIDGEGGADRLWGRGGDDTLDGGAGNDRLFGGRGADMLDGGVGNDRLFGGRGEDVLLGGDGNDRLRGGGGDDTLDGGAGQDRYRGDGGADQFVFGVDGVRDIVKDFRPGVDTLDLTAFALDSASDVLSGARQRGDDLYLRLGGGDVIKLDDVSLGDLDASDFIL